MRARRSFTFALKKTLGTKCAHLNARGDTRFSFSSCPRFNVKQESLKLKTCKELKFSDRGWHRNPELPKMHLFPTKECMCPRSPRVGFANVLKIMRGTTGASHCREQSHQKSEEEQPNKHSFACKYEPFLGVFKRNQRLQML